jgi:hypothetical protein
MEAALDEEVMTKEEEQHNTLQTCKVIIVNAGCRKNNAISLV